MGLIGCVEAECVQFCVSDSSCAASLPGRGGGWVTGEPVSRGLLTAQKGGGEVEEGWGGGQANA